MHRAQQNGPRPNATVRGKQDKPPRDTRRRGEGGGRRAFFYALLGKMRLAGRPAGHRPADNADAWSNAHVMALAGFLAEERWITMPHPYSAPLDDFTSV